MAHGARGAQVARVALVAGGPRRYLEGVETECCQYCGVDLEETPPGEEQGYLYGVECSRCPPERRRLLMLARPARAETLDCPDCGATLAPAATHPDVLVVKEMVYEVCAGCGARRGVARVRKLRDLTDGAG